MAQRTPVLHVQPFPQAHAMEKVLALRDLRRLHLLVADGAHIFELPQLLLVSFGQALDLVDGRPPFHENGPSGLGVAPNVKVGVYAHHDRTDRATALEQQYPGAVEE